MRHFPINALMLACLGALAGCEPSPESARGFRLPDGDPQAGEETFLALQCNACHQVEGLELPPLQGTGPAMVTLGGDIARVKTYGELVTSIINPSHRLVSGHPEEEVSRNGESLMTVFNEVMTVQQLIDLVAFLQSHYEVLPPAYNPYNVYQY